MDLKDILQLLEAENDNHWTADGLPVVAVVSELAERSVTRQQITEAAPEFTRQSLLEPAPEPVVDGTLEVPGEAPLEAEVVAERLEDPRRQLEAVDAELVRLQELKADIQDKINKTQAEREKLDQRITSKYDFATDQDRRMAHIQANNKRKYDEAIKRKALVTNLTPEVLAAVKATMAPAAPVRKPKHQVPPRLFNQKD